MKSMQLAGIAWVQQEIAESWRVFRRAPLRALWGGLAIFSGLCFIGGLAMLVTVGAGLWSALFFLGSLIAPTRTSAIMSAEDRWNPFRYAFDLAAFVMWHLVYPAAGIRLSLTADPAQFTPFRPGEVGKVYIVHPSYAGVPPLAYVLSQLLPHLWCMPMKGSLMKFPVGWAMAAIRMGIPINRGSPAQSVRAIAAAARRGYTVAIAPEGTRPTDRSIADTRRFLEQHGWGKRYPHWRHTSGPRPAGALEIERAMPNARRILLLSASSISEGGMAGLLRMIVERARIAFEVRKWEGVFPQTEEALQHVLLEAWTQIVHPWIDVVREPQESC
jgi:hypothetical protein